MYYLYYTNILCAYLLMACEYVMHEAYGQVYLFVLNTTCIFDFIFCATILIYYINIYLFILCMPFSYKMFGKFFFACPCLNNFQQETKNCIRTQPQIF